MSLHDPRAIANEFLVRANGIPLSQRVLHTLLYALQGWSLAITENPFLKAQFDALDGGPTCRQLKEHFSAFNIGISYKLLMPRRGSPYASALSTQDEDLVARIWKRYGAISSKQIMGITHAEGTPWSNAYFGNSPGALITQASMRSYFTRLAAAGR